MRIKYIRAEKELETFQNYSINEYIILRFWTSSSAQRSDSLFVISNNRIHISNKQEIAAIYCKTH